MDECISREAAIEALSAEALERNLDSVMTDDAHRYHRAAERVIAGVPAADVVSRDAFNRILAENDDMRAMLAQIGKKPGDSMDDVRRAKRGKWIYDCERTMGDGWTYKQRHCSECGYQTVKCDNFCPNCGAIMDA